MTSSSEQYKSLDENLQQDTSSRRFQDNQRYQGANTAKATTMATGDQSLTTSGQQISRATSPAMTTASGTNFSSLPVELQQNIFDYVFASDRKARPLNDLVAHNKNTHKRHITPNDPVLAVSREWYHAGCRSFYKESTFQIDPHDLAFTKWLPDNIKALITKAEIDASDANLCEGEEGLKALLDGCKNLHKLKIRRLRRIQIMYWRKIYRNKGLLSLEEIKAISWVPLLTSYPNLRDVRLDRPTYQIKNTTTGQYFTALRRITAWIDIQLRWKREKHFDDPVAFYLKGKKKWPRASKGRKERKVFCEGILDGIAAMKVLGMWFRKIEEPGGFRKEKADMLRDAEAWCKEQANEWVVKAKRKGKVESDPEFESWLGDEGEFGVRRSKKAWIR